jgi:pyocin large subunit-like protein
MAFSNARQLSRHFAEHGAEFGAATIQDYERLANSFLLGPPSPTMLQCKRQKGDLIRFDTDTGAYGVLDQNSVIRTFFKPLPCVSLPQPQRAAVKRLGRCHDHANNLLYFHWDCGR